MKLFNRSVLSGVLPRDTWIEPTELVSAIMTCMLKGNVPAIGLKVLPATFKVKIDNERRRMRGRRLIIQKVLLVF